MCFDDGTNCTAITSSNCGTVVKGATALTDDDC